MRVVADRTRCVGAGQCVLAAPAVFDQDEDEGLVVVLQEEPGAELADGVRRAEGNCPAMAIEVEET
jgi:ferredoxin